MPYGVDDKFWTRLPPSERARITNAWRLVRAPAPPPTLRQPIPAPKAAPVPRPRAEDIGGLSAARAERVAAVADSGTVRSASTAGRTNADAGIGGLTARQAERIAGDSLERPVQSHTKQARIRTQTPGGQAKNASATLQNRAAAVASARNERALHDSVQTTEHFFDITAAGIDVRNLRRAGGMQRYVLKRDLHETWWSRAQRLPGGDEDPEAARLRLRAWMQLQAEQAAAHPDVPLETIQRFALESSDALEIAGKALGIGGAAIGAASFGYAIVEGRARFRTVADKVNAAATVLGVGGGIGEILLMTTLPIPAVGEAVVTIVGVGVGVTGLGLLTADLITRHAAEIEYGIRAAPSLLQRNPEIAPTVAAIAALVSHRGNIVAAAERLEASLRHRAPALLRGGERASSAAVTVGGHVFHDFESVGRRAAHWGADLASDLIP